jgi:hypothetical protein
MPIQAEPDGTLDVENATLRSRNIVSLTSLVAGNDVVRSTAAPTLEVYGDPSHGGTEPTLELVSNVGAAGSAFTRLTSNAGVFTIQSGTAGTADSKGDIAFSSVGGSTEHMRIQGSTERVGIGTTDPGAKLHVNGGKAYIDGFDNVLLEAKRSGVGPAVRLGSTDGILEIGTIASTYGNETVTMQSYIDQGNSGTYSSIDRNLLALQPYAGRVGIGKTDPISVFNVKQSADNSPAGSFIISPVSGSLSYWGMYVSGGNDFVFHQNGSDRGFLANGYNVTAIDFTGQHRNFIDGVSYANYDSLEGLIVSANKNKYYDIDENVTTGANAIQISQSLPLVALSTTEKDKACFGVISGVEDPETREYAQGSFVSVVQKQRGDRRAFINSVGEGAIWVTNINGPLESGDYITTSNVAGYGQKQDSEFLANYTVAKITMDCDFDPVTQPVQIIRKEMGDVNYWVKTTYENVTEEEYSNLTDENRRIVDDVYQKITKKESKTEREGWELEVRQELVNVLDTNGQLQWEDHPTETETAYKIRYLDANGNITDEANHVYKAAFVGCTYHCG